jgi:protein-S-isoprenylcysteine O-methyltransferase Ste14
LEEKNMNANTPTQKSPSQADTAAGIRKRATQIVFQLVLQGVILFGGSGQFDWGMAWILLGVNVAFITINTAVILRIDPELIAERAEIKEDAKRWDRPMAGIVSAYGPLSGLLVAALDRRWMWSPPIHLNVQLIALAIVTLGYFLWGWAMASNRFFAGLVRIQKERGHTVATGGPYRFVRHPGYAGMTLFTLLTPFVLGSFWALIPAGITMVALIIRTALEDKTLRGELPGYADYAQQVRFRLLPGIW